MGGQNTTGTQASRHYHGALLAMTPELGGEGVGVADYFPPPV